MEDNIATKTDECYMEADVTTEVEPGGLCTSTRARDITMQKSLAKVMQLTNKLLLVLLIGVLIVMSTTSSNFSDHTYHSFSLNNWYVAETECYSLLYHNITDLTLNYHEYSSSRHNIEKIDLELNKLPVITHTADGADAILQDDVNKIIYLGNIHPSDVLVSLYCLPNI